MNNFRYITHLDTFAVVSQLFRLKPADWKGLEYRCEIGDERLPTRSLALRGRSDYTMETWLEDLPLSDAPELEKWPSMQRLVRAARRAIQADQCGAWVDWAAPIGRAMITGLDPGGAILWHRDDGPYNSRHMRFHVPLVTNPLALMYSGPESLHMPVGSLWLFNNQIKHSAANWGDGVRYHLIFELRRAGLPDTEE